jgi:UDP-N-acetylmuramoyl-tripeptide--D-alanyl-D-alanine ligase
MATLDPHEAATIAHGCWAASPPPSPLTSFAIDTRRIEPGETFVALKSDRLDGHAFLRKAFEYRAMAALVEHADADVPIPQLVVRDSLEALQSLAGSWRERFRSPVVGITGSNGKTTVKEMLGKVLGSQWFRTKGNYNNHIGVPLSLLDLDPRMHAGAILEAGINDVGEMSLLAGMIRPDHVIITSVGPSHLERLGTLEGVAREKAILAESVRPGGSVYLPASLLQYEAFRNLSPRTRIHALLREGEIADPAWADLPNVTIYHYNWTETVLSRGAGVLETKPPVHPGAFQFKAGSAGMISNLALVVHVAQQLNVPSETIQACLDAWRPFRQRGEVIVIPPTSYYVDCYNANPGSMLDSMQRFSHLFPDEKHAYVIGSMNELGSETREWHRKTGRDLVFQAEASISLVGEQADALYSGLEDQGVDPSRVRIEHDRAVLRDCLLGFRGAVFLKGSRTLGLESIVPGGEPSC